MQYTYTTTAVAVSIIMFASPVSLANDSAEFFAPNATVPALNYRTADNVINSLEGIEYEVIDGHAIAEGDMVLGKVDSQGNVFNSAKRGIGQSALVFRWTNGIIPYQFNAEIPSAVKAISLQAIAHWNKYTTVSFVELSDENRDQFENYITFKPSAGCSSFVGMQGGEQPLWVSQACGAGSIAHELGHAVGLFHEHTRNDRDNHISVEWNNIAPDRQFNFQTINTGSSQLGEYDYGSIMHYGEKVFSANNLPTIKAHNGAEIGQRIALSEKDIQSVNSMYETDLALNLDARTDTENNTITTEIMVTNQGNMGSNKLELLIDIGVSGNWTSISSESGWHCEAHQTKLLCQRNFLDSGATSIFTVVANAQTATEATIKAKLLAKTRDIDYHNNAFNDLIEAPLDFLAVNAIANNSDYDTVNTELAAALPSAVSSVMLPEFNDDQGKTLAPVRPEGASANGLNPIVESSAFSSSSNQNFRPSSAASGTFSPLTSFGLTVTAGLFTRRRRRFRIKP